MVEIVTGGAAAGEPDVPQNLLDFPDGKFLGVWRKLSEQERAKMPADQREAAIKRYSKLTPWIDETSARLSKIQSRDTTGEFDDVRTAGAIMDACLGPARYCVEKRVPAGLVIIGGRPKSKKSWWALQLALAKASGGQFMGIKTDPVRAFYIALEDNDRRMRTRLEFFGTTPECAPQNLHLVYEWPSGVEGIEKIDRWMRLHPDTGLVIIDVLQRFRGRSDPRSSAYEGDYQTMAMLHGLTKRHQGLTVLVVHHVKKGPVDDPVEAINGTFAIAGAADAYIILRRGGEKDQWIAHIDGRDWESWDHDHLWEFVPQEGWRQIGVADGIELNEAQREILDHAKNLGHLTPTKLMPLRGCSKQAAQQALMALVNKGAMRVYAGKYYGVNQ